MLAPLLYYAPDPADPSRLRVVEVRESQTLPLRYAKEHGLATLDAYEEDVEVTNNDGDAVGVANFAAHEERGGELVGYGHQPLATGAATWPEWLSAPFLRTVAVELEPGWSRLTPREDRTPYRIRALVHVGAPASTDARGLPVPAIAGSGHRRERAVIEAAIAERIAAANGEPADIRDIVGGPDSPLLALIAEDTTQTPEEAPSDADSPGPADTSPR